jgi:integrase
MAKNSSDTAARLDQKSFRFTPDRLAEACRLAGQAGARKTWRDDGCKHLVVRVGPRGGVFYRYGRADGHDKPVYQRIGEVAGPNAVPLETARRRCNELRFDPNSLVTQKQRRRRSIGPTVGVAWAEYIDAASSGLFAMGRNRRPLRESTAKAYRDIYNPYLKPHAEKSLSWLAENVKQIFETLGTRGIIPLETPRRSPAAANKLLQVVKNLFEFCRERGYWDGPNPTSDPRTGRPYQKFSVPRREVLLSDDQSTRLLRAVRSKGDFWMDFFTLSLLTGRRLSNVRRLRWDTIDLKRGIIFSSAEEMKNAQADVARLSPEALEILHRRKKAATHQAEWVFPGRKPGLPIHNPDHAWNVIRVAAGLPKLRIHDLRHTAGTWATEAGISTPGVGSYLSHKSLTSTQRYQHASDVEKQRAADAVGARVSALLKAGKARKSGTASRATNPSPRGDE